MKNNVALLYNFAQHYREEIFVKLAEECGVDFYFGENNTDIKEISTDVLKYTTLSTVFIGKIYYISGSLKLLSRYSKIILLGNPYCLSNWLLLFIALFSSNKKIYLWTHGWYGKENLIERILKLFMFKLSDGLFLYGDYAKDNLLKRGVTKEKMHVLYNSLAYSKQLPHRNTLLHSNIDRVFKNNNKTLVFIGRLTKVKKLNLLIDLCVALQDKGEPVNLLIVGSGTEEEKLKKEVLLKGVRSVCFYGECYDERKIAELLFQSDLCISPGNIGLTAMHSLMYGTPCVSHDNFPQQMPEFEAIQPEISGMFYKYDSFESLVDVTYNWLTAAGYDREVIRKNCFSVIDSKYNPSFQVEVIRKALL